MLRHVLLPMGIVFALTACSGESVEISEEQDPLNLPVSHPDGVETSEEQDTLNLKVSHPDGVEIAVEGEVELKAIVINKDNSVAKSTRSNPTTVIWYSSDSSIATVDDSGLLTGVSAGAVSILAEVVEGGMSITSTEIPVSVNPGNVGSVILSPARMSIDVKGERSFLASAIDLLGAPLKLQCSSTSEVNIAHQPTWPEDNNAVVEAYYHEGSNELRSTGLAEGLSMLSLNCGGFNSSPVIVGVKQATAIPATLPIGLNGEEYQVGLVINNNDQQHVVVYSEASKRLTYWLHNNDAWEPELLDGISNYGVGAEIALNPISGRPIICAPNDLALSCWFQTEDGHWDSSTVDSQIATSSEYQGELSLVVSAQGEIYLAYYDDITESANIAISGVADPSSWDVYHIAEGVSPYVSIALAEDQSPRAAIQYENRAYYGMPVDGDMSRWGFELVSEDGGSSGKHIELQVGTDHRPQIVYVKNENLIYRVKDLGVWVGSNLGDISISSQLSFAIDSRNLPRITYQNSQSNTLQYAYRYRKDRKGLNDRWRIDQPAVASNISAHHSLSVDDIGRAHIAYYDADSASVQYYVEPYFFDYSPFDVPNENTIDNTLVDSPVLVAKLNPVSFANTEEVEVTWDKVENASGYKFYWYGVDPRNEKPEVGYTVENSWNETGLSTGNTYYYRISSITPLGESASTALIPLEIKALEPTDVSILSDNGANKISWSPVEDIKYYTVYWGRDAKFESSIGSANVDSQSTFYIHSTELPDLYYWVTASDESSESNPSLSLQAPIAPVGVSVIENYSNGSAFIEWNPVRSADSYSVYLTSESILNRQNSRRFKTNQASIELTDLKLGQSYIAAVSVNNELGESRLSAQVKFSSAQSWVKTSLSEVSKGAYEGLIDFSNVTWQAISADQNDVHLLGHDADTQPLYVSLQLSSGEVAIHGAPESLMRNPAFIAERGTLSLIGGERVEESEIITDSDAVIPSAIISNYDSSSGQWNESIAMHFSRMQSRAVSHHGRQFIFGGYEYAPFNTDMSYSFCYLKASDRVEVYDPAENEVKLYGRMPESRGGFAVAQSGSEILFFGGNTGRYCLGEKTETLVNSVIAYDPYLKIWTNKKAMPTFRLNPVAAAYREYIFIFGGTDQNGNYIRNIDIYNTYTNQWSTDVASPIDIEIQYGQIVDDKIILFGKTGDSFYIYDPNVGVDSSLNIDAFSTFVDANKSVEVNVQVGEVATQVSWGSVPGATHYELHWVAENEEGAAMSEPNVIRLGETHYTHYSPMGDAVYRYKVFAFNGALSTLPSTAQFARNKLATPVGIKLEPSYLFGDSTPAGQNKLTWDAVPGAKSYTIWGGLNESNLEEIYEISAGQAMLGDGKLTYYHTPDDDSYNGNRDKDYSGTYALKGYAISANGTNEWSTSNVSRLVKELSSPNYGLRSEPDCTTLCARHVRMYTASWMSFEDIVHDRGFNSAFFRVPTTIRGNLDFVPGAEIGSDGAHFDGHSYIELPHFDNQYINTGEFTFSSWVKPQISGGVIMSNDDYQIEVVEGRVKLMLTYGGELKNIFTSHQMLKTIDQASWHHILVTASGEDKTKISVYINGDQHIAYQLPVKLSKNTLNTVYIGKSTLDTDPRYLEGTLDQIKLLRIGLTHQQAVNEYLAASETTQNNGRTLSWEAVPRATVYKLYIGVWPSSPEYNISDLPLYATTKNTSFVLPESLKALIYITAANENTETGRTYGRSVD